MPFIAALPNFMAGLIHSLRFTSSRFSLIYGKKSYITRLKLHEYWVWGMFFFSPFSHVHLATTLSYA